MARKGESPFADHGYRLISPILLRRQAPTPAKIVNIGEKVEVTQLFHRSSRS